MKIQVNTDNNIEGREKLIAHVSSVVESTLMRFNDQVTLVDVHLSDQNGAKGGPDDKRCMMEARLKNHRPAVVTHEAATLGQAVDGAADRLLRSLNGMIERLRDHG